ncbi:MAG: FKBP-type peptidyl-prolyl cis-trans isomerase [Clostridia bacterium]|nr:FKBP-type peptidyl-prolyl cis-trans isomerase [Clostridia bacterium]
MKKAFAVAFLLLAALCLASCGIFGEGDVTTADMTVTASDITVTDTVADITGTAEPVATTVPEETTAHVTEVTSEPVEYPPMTEEPVVTTAPEVTVTTEVTTASTEETTSSEPEEFSFETSNLDKYIKLGKYLGIEVFVEPSVPLTDEQIETEIELFVESILLDAAILEGQCKDGDKVNIDYTGTIDGKTFYGSSAEGQILTLGEHEYILDVDDGIVGMSVGETREVIATFPLDYGAEALNGKTAVFEITLNFIYPLLTDELVAEYTDYLTVDEFKQSIRDSAEEEAVEERKAAAWTKAMANSRIIGYPDAAVDAAFESQISSYKRIAETYGLTYEQLICDVYGLDISEAESVFTEYAKNDVAQQLLLYAIARDMGMDISDAAYEEEILDLMVDAGFDSIDELTEATGYSKAYLKELLIYQDVLDEIVAQANFVETFSK